MRTLRNSPNRMLAAMLTLVSASFALASDAETSATAGRVGGRPGNAAATARYEGDVGFARTQTRSGNLTLARGVAVGVDQDGLSLSLSSAIAPRFGPALASNFNLSIGRDGEVSHSGGLSVAGQSPVREASAGGFTRVNRFDGATGGATATGRTGPGGVVDASTHASSSPQVLGRSLAEREPVQVVRRDRFDRNTGNPVRAVRRFVRR